MKSPATRAARRAAVVLSAAALAAATAPTVAGADEQTAGPAITAVEPSGETITLTAEEHEGDLRFVDEEGNPVPGGVRVLEGGTFVHDPNAPDGTFELADQDRAFKRSDRGGVEVPADYVYNPDLGPRHDYCTNSPDQFPAIGVNADFSGACARHDMCYDEADRRGTGYGPCNNALSRDMWNICGAVYPGFDLRKARCRATARAYHRAVTIFHAGQN